MSFEKSKNQYSEPLWRMYRDQFPVAGHLVYLNHASVGPLSRRTAEAMNRLAEDVLWNGALHYDSWVEAYEAVRVAAARLIGAARSEIAIVKNTSEGIATVALGFPWRAGDALVCFEEEFPANDFPWRRLESRGVRVKRLSIYDSLDRIDEACRAARLLAVSFVNYLSGKRMDLSALGEICRRRDCFFFVDAIQGLGAFPVDVEAAHIDALSADGHKWMLGPEGCGILYVRKDRQELIEPVEFGWSNVARYADYASRDLTLRPDAGRYECGTLNTIGCFGLRAALELLIEIGIDRIASDVLALGDSIAAGVQERGYEVLGRRTAADGAGIVAFRKPGLDSRAVVSRLQSADIVAAPRQGWVRASPHFYVSPGDIGRMLEALP